MSDNFVSENRIDKGIMIKKKKREWFNYTSEYNKPITLW
jgi:hypothetical protein